MGENPPYLCTLLRARVALPRVAVLHRRRAKSTCAMPPKKKTFYGTQGDRMTSFKNRPKCRPTHFCQN
jgi:hypothetical protein